MKTYICSGEAAALEAGAHDFCECRKCHEMFPGGELLSYGGEVGNICTGCADELEGEA